MKRFYQFIVLLMATLLLSNSIFSHNVYAATKVKALKYKKVGINIHDSQPLSRFSNMLDDVVYDATTGGAIELKDGNIIGRSLTEKGRKDFLYASYTNAKGKDVTEKCIIVVENPVFLSEKVYVNQDKKTNIKFSGTAFKPSSYTTDNNFIAIVDKKGKVTGVNTGTCNVTAELNGVSYNSVVTVEDPHLKEKSIIMGLEDKRLVSLLGTEQIPKWKSSKPAVATVDEFGVVESKKPGRTTVSCKINNTTYRVKVTVNKNVKTHECKFGKSQVEREATCSENGLSCSKCIYCGNIKDNVIPATGHTPGNWIVDKDATCTELGHKYKKCLDCDAIVEEEDLPMREHVLSISYVAKTPTCTEEGMTCQICQLCHESYNIKKISALGHSFKDTVLVTPNGCNKEGLQRSYCTRCAKNIEETIEKIPHVVADNWTVTEKATCIHDGHRVKRCLLCGDVCQEETIKATGHNFEDNFDYTTLKGFGIKQCCNCGFCTNETPITYSIEFDGNGSDLSIPSITVSYNSLTRLPRVGDYEIDVVSPTNGGEVISPLNGKAKFIGWSTDKNSAFSTFEDNAFIYNLTHVKDEIVKLFAVFTDKDKEVAPFSVTYKTEVNGNFVTYHTQNGKAVVGSTITPQPINIPGYTTPDVQSITIEKDGTNDIVYLYRVHGYNLSLSKDEGVKNITGSGVYHFGDNVTSKAVMKEGYEFDGWEGSLNGIAETYSFRMPDNNMAMQATSKELEYDITFDLNGGAVSADLPDSYKYWDEEIAVENPVKTNETFVGWVGSCGQMPVKNLVIDTAEHRDLQYEAVFKSMFEDVEVGTTIKDADAEIEYTCVDTDYNNTGYALFIMDGIVPCNGTLSSEVASYCPVFSEYSGTYKDSLLRAWLNSTFYDSVTSEIKDRIVPLTTEGLNDAMWVPSFNDVEKYSEFLSKKWTQEEGKWGYWTRTSYLNKATNKLSVYYVGPAGIGVEDIGAKVAFLVDLKGE